MRWRLWILLPFTLLLSACGAWPTIIYNQSGHAIILQYHQKNYAEWSYALSLDPGSTKRLAREHWIQDITAFRITEGDTIYTINRAELETVRLGCDSAMLGRGLLLAPDCYVTYHGGGKLSASLVRPGQQAAQGN